MIPLLVNNVRITLIISNHYCNFIHVLIVFSKSTGCINKVIISLEANLYIFLIFLYNTLSTSVKIYH